MTAEKDVQVARKKGRGGRGNSGNARKKTFIFIWGLPLPEAPLRERKKYTRESTIGLIPCPGHRVLKISNQETIECQSKSSTIFWGTWYIIRTGWTGAPGMKAPGLNCINAFLTTKERSNLKLGQFVTCLSRFPQAKRQTEAKEGAKGPSS